MPAVRSTKRIADLITIRDICEATLEYSKETAQISNRVNTTAQPLLSIILFSIAKYSATNLHMFNVRGHGALLMTKNKYLQDMIPAGLLF